MGGDLTASIPVYVTRKTASGQIAEYSMTIWMPILAMFVVWANIVTWGLFGLYTFVTLVV